MHRLVAVLSCLAVTLAGCLVLLAGPPAASAALAVAQQAGTFHPVEATRVLDTRTSGGLAGARIVRFAVAGRGTIPANAAAVTINMTVLGPATAGSISVFPGDTAWNGAASISFAAKQIKQNMITAKLGGNGTLAVRNNLPTAIQVIGDVVGYYTGGTATTAGAFQSIGIQRVFDTRPSHPLAPASVTRMQVGGKGAVPASGVAAVVADLTVISPARSGSVSTWASNAAWDGSASESFAAARSEQDVLAVSLGPDGAAMIRNNTAVSLQVVLDVIGYYLAGTPSGYGAYQPVTPTRIFDSRLNNLNNYPLTTGIPVSIQANRDAVSGAVRLPRWQVPAVVVRYTVLTPAKAGGISVFPGTEDWNGSVSMSFGAAVSVQQQLTTVLGPDGQLQLQNDAAPDLVVIADVLGYYLGVPNPLHYAGSQEIDPRHGRLAGISCPTASFCLAAEQAGFATSWNGSRWNSPVRAGQSLTLSSVSCASASFCLAGGTAVGGTPELSVFDGSSWSHSGSLAGRSTDVQVSCASASFCLATDETSYRTFDGSSWSAEQPTGGNLRSVSCASASLCRAVDQLGRLYSFTGSGWSAPGVLAGFAPWAVSCTSTAFCVAVGQDSAAELVGASWTVYPAVDPGRSLLSVSCASSTNCRAVDDLGGVVGFDGTNWSGRVLVDPNGGAAISCAPGGTCAVIDSSTHVTAAMFDGTSWSAVQPVDLLPGNLDGVSCTDSSFCVAVDTGGYAFSYDGSNWSTPVQVTGGTALTSVSCAPPTSCLAVDAAGRAVSFDGTVWSAPVSVDAGQRLTAVSCADPSFCVAVGMDGKAAVFNGSSWSAPVTVFGQPAAAVSCPTDTFCAATDFAGNAATFNGSSWSVSTHSGSGTDGLSCVSAASCLAAGTGFAAWDGTGWSPVAGPVKHGNLAVSCPDQQLCVLANADGSGQALVWDGSQWSMSVDSPAAGTYTGSDISCPTTDFCMQVNGYTSAYRITS